MLGHRDSTGNAVFVEYILGITENHHNERYDIVVSNVLKKG